MCLKMSNIALIRAHEKLLLFAEFLLSGDIISSPQNQMNVHRKAEADLKTNKK